MSSIRNTFQRRNHKEQSQPAERSRLGLLEKHKVRLYFIYFIQPSIHSSIHLLPLFPSSPLLSSLSLTVANLFLYYCDRITPSAPKITTKRKLNYGRCARRPPTGTRMSSSLVVRLHLHFHSETR